VAGGGQGRGGLSVRVFVASTYDDLLSYRAAATRSILTSGNLSEDMLFWPAEESPPLDVSLRKVRSCNLLILLIAHRYGKSPEGQNVSITELEFREAVAQGIPVLAFSVNPTYPWPPNHMENDAAVRGRLEAFIQEVGKQVTHKEFTSPESLEVAITHALTQFMVQARHTELPRYVRARACQVARPDSLYYSADSTIQIGRAPAGAPLLLSITRHIRVEDDLAAIAARLGKDSHDPVFKEILAQLNQEARTFAATTGIYDSVANGNAGKFYVPNEPLTHQIAPSLFQSILGRADVFTHSIDSGPMFSPGPARPHFSPGVPGLNASTVDSGRAPDRSTLAPSGFEPSRAEPRVVSFGGMNRFLCIALDSSPTTWSGGWAVHTSQRKLIIGRPFIEEGLERLAGVEYKIAQHGSELIGTNRPSLFTQKWTEVLSSADDGELSQFSHKITIPRASIARFTLEVIDEVSRLHESGRVHGDIKPSNILVSRNDKLLIDDADLRIGDISPTVTLGWSPSEQVLRQPLSAAADIFSVGQLLLHVLAAEPLGREVRYRMPGGQMALTFDDPTVYIESANPYAPVETREDWCRLIERALRTNANERWPTAGSMADEMRELLQKEDLRGEIEIRLPWGDRPFLILDSKGQPTAGWIIQSGYEKTLLSS
jgi:hypothetical protein